MLKALARHPMRPAHIHFIVTAAGFDSLATHVFLAGDPYLQSDAVFGVKDALIREVEVSQDAERAAALGTRAPFKSLDIDIRLQREAAGHILGSRASLAEGMAS